MESLIKSLEKYLRSLNVEQLYNDPGHQKSKDWLAGVAAIFKSNRKSAYKRFISLSQHIYPSIPLATRKHAAEQIDVFMRQIIAEYKAGNTVPQNLDSGLQPHLGSSGSSNNQNPDIETYINKSILEGFRSKTSDFNYQKLITLIEELNFNYLNKKTYSSCMLLRAILDHIPPLLTKNDFNDVVNNYSWGSEKSSRLKALKELLTFRNTPDDILHAQITNKSDVIDISYLPNKFPINILLQECLESNTKPFIDTKLTKTRMTKDESIQVDLIIDFDEQKISWANYAVSRWVWPSFRMVLSINNFHNKSAEYLRAYLSAKSNDGIWEARNFVFLNRENEDKSRPNEDFRVEAGYKEKVSLFVSIYDIKDRDQKSMPDIDRDTLKLVIKTESGKTLTLPIKAGWISNS